MDVTWQKVLWQRQPIADNYIPQAFLSSLRTNPNFEPYTYWPLVLLSCGITQHIATLFIFIATFIRLKERSLDPNSIIWISIGCFIVGYIVWELLEYPAAITLPHTRRVKAFKSSILMFLALVSLSPVLRTLTAATSSDSIWALSAGLFSLNTILADYSATKARGQERLTSVLSMNAAISSSVVLASRLSDDISVFALILYAVQLFALFPLLRHRLQTLSSVIQCFTTVLIVTIALFLTTSVSWFMARILLALLFCVTFLAPATLIWAQKYKNEIRGPWDVAVPRVN